MPEAFERFKIVTVYSVSGFLLILLSTYLMNGSFFALGLDVGGVSVTSLSQGIWFCKSALPSLLVGAGALTQLLQPGSNQVSQQVVDGCGRLEIVELVYQATLILGVLLMVRGTLRNGTSKE